MTTHPTEPSRVRWHPSSNEEKTFVREEMEAILATAQFTNSKRYPAFLRYVVDKELHGLGDQLKERNIGVDVFNRPHDYDTNSDTVVRFTAGEVRKRLSRYYYETGPENGLRIVLPAGSYVPEFYRDSLGAEEQHLHLPLDPEPWPPRRPPASPAARRRWVLPLIASLAVVALAAAWQAHRLSQRELAIDQFWSPYLSSLSPALICPGTLASDSKTVSVETATSLAGITDLFGRQHIAYIVQPTPAANLTDLRRHPVVLIGAYTNDWTLRLTQSLRFHFAPLPAMQIVDSANPAAVWAMTGNTDTGASDYALIARYHDPETDNFVMAIAGLQKNGTEAAGEFVTSPKNLELLNRILPPGWENRNLEVVLKTDVIENKTGAPSIVATYVW